ncbi:MAG: ABC transporter substrate-binding protein [Maribacter sp.]|nr:ABC transporter substrate-binding protein [Maribacter sp.]
MKRIIFLALLLSIIGCKNKQKTDIPLAADTIKTSLTYAKGFSIEKSNTGLTILKISSPWPDAKTEFTYALVPKDKMSAISLNRDAYDAIVEVPVNTIVVTSTTHIPALESLGVLDHLVGFPDTDYISSKNARRRITEGKIKDLGNSEALNTEMVIELHPDVVIGFGMGGQDKAYKTIQLSNIPVIYNGDWTEETPLGKAEWIKFFAPFFQLENKGDELFKEIESAYLSAKTLAQKVTTKPTVLSGALYKDVWYLPGGKSWAATFLDDANATYLWRNTQETGSLSLSIESVLDIGRQADFWVSPSQFTSYLQMEEANRHYLQFKAFKNKKIYTFASTKGESGGLLYYELAPQRPDLVLKDLIYIFHPELLPDHHLFFFKPLE